MLELDKRTILAALAATLLCAAILVRVIGINAPAPLSDELLWRSRSAKVLQKLRTGDFSNATTHLTHPGVPAATAMAVGQHLASRATVSNNRMPGDPNFCDTLCGSRMAIMLLSALLVPAIFLAVARYSGTATGVIAALLVTLSPFHIFASRLAHLDALLTLLTLSAVFLYLTAIEKRSLPTKVFAGVLFGLALATKPTAALALPCLILFKVIRNILVPIKRGGERSVLTWSDVWTFLTSLAVLSVVFTRLWIEKPRYQIPMALRNGLLRELRSLASAVDSQWLLIGAFLVTSIFCGFSAWKIWQARAEKTYSPIRYHLLMAATLCGVIGLTFSLFPLIYINQVRFWAWVVSLQNRQFDSGESWNPYPFGYPGLIAAKVPEGILALFIVGILIIFFSPLKKGRDAEEARAFWITCILLLVCWIIPLNKSQKQDFRYLLPVLPVFYMVAARAVTTLFGWIPNLPLRFALFATPGLYLGYLLLALYPSYHLHFNSISGGIEEVRAQRQRFYFSGHKQAIDFIKHQADERYPKMDINVLVDGDTVDVFKASYLRSTATQERRIYFDYRDSTRTEQLFDAHYWIALGLFDDQMIRKKKIEEITGPLQLRYSYTVNGSDLLRVYEIPPYHFREPLEFPVYKSSSHTGTVVWPQNASGTEGAVEAFPGKHEPGYLFLGNILRLPPGIYEIEYDIEFPGAQIHPKGYKSEPALTVQLATDCKEVIRIPNSPPFQKRYRQRCVLTGPRKAGPSGYWPGKAAVRVTRISVNRRDLRSK